MVPLLLLAVLLVSLPSLSQKNSPSSPAPLQKTDKTSSVTVDSWSVSFENVPDRDALSKKAAWQTVELPATYKLADSTPMKLQYIWFRGEFIINGAPVDYYGVSMGRVYHSDKVFINGRLVGEKTSKDFFELHYPRDYIIPEGVLNQGTNSIMVRVGIFSDQYGGLTDTVRVLTWDDFKEKLAKDNFTFLLLPFGFLTLYLGFSVLLFLLFIFTRVEQKLIYCSIGLLFYIFLILILFFPYQSPVISVPLAIQLSIQITALKVLIPLFLIILVLIIQSLYRASLIRYNLKVISVSLLIVIMIIINAIVFSNPYMSGLNVFLLLLMIIPGTSYLAFMAWKLNSMQPDKAKIRMIAAMLFLANLTILWEGVSYSAGGCSYGIFAVFISPVIIIIFLMLFVKDYMNNKIETALLYSKLKQPYPRGAGHDDDRPAITESSEEKLKRVIAFIEENYTSDISREGLAAAVDLNPNYMSRIFTSYTGKKINEYINELRIKNAVKKIGEGDMLIIDIALACGFESLSTFNRAFKKYTGKTPSEFKTNT